MPTEFKRYTWKVCEKHSESTANFPLAVIDNKGSVVALVKTWQDAKFIADSARKIAELGSDSSRNRALHLGSLARSR